MYYTYELSIINNGIGYLFDIHPNNIDNKKTIINIVILTFYGLHFHGIIF